MPNALIPNDVTKKMRDAAKSIAAGQKRERDEFKTEADGKSKQLEQYSDILKEGEVCIQRLIKETGSYISTKEDLPSTPSAADKPTGGKSSG